MRRYENYLYLLLRVLSILVVGDLMQDMPYALELEMARIATLQAYIASAGRIVPNLSWRYAASSTTSKQVSTLVTRWLHRASLDAVIPQVARRLPRHGRRIYEMVDTS
jgi:hypothetical protein